MSDYFYILLSFSILSFTLCLLCLSLYKTLFNRNQKVEQTQNQEVLDKPPNENDPTHSLLLEILPTDSAKWFCDQPSNNHHDLIGSGQDNETFTRKKKKRKGKKKRLDLNIGEKEEKREVCECPGNWVNPELVCLYPFTSTSSATQRKIKQHYDQLVKYHENKRLTLAQVGEFAHCLSEARNELQQKSEVIKRKFKLTKALLFKADRSCFDRLRQQIYKLEMEQKRLEEDAFVYNWLQEQLKLSQAYKKMLEINACMETEAKSIEPMDSADTVFPEISFEELLAQEKKDSFWRKRGKSRLSSS